MKCGHLVLLLTVIGELLGEIYFLVYTLREGKCRIITAWIADKYERETWYDYTL
jgi:uncharacterized DUF497 family protein